MRKKIFIIAIAAFLVLGFLPIPLETVSPPEAEADRVHWRCWFVVSSDYIGIACEVEIHDH